MDKKLIIDGNAVYELDEDCMLRKRLDEEKKEAAEKSVQKNLNEK